MQDQGRRRPLWQVVLVLVLGALLALLFARLGIWQIDRLGWKRALIARVEMQLAADPLPLNEIADLPPELREYRKVRVTGTFDHTAETLTKAVTKWGSGFWVITPLSTDAGQTVLINRGFVPPEQRDPATRPDGLIQGRVTVTGLVRLSEPDGGFLKDNDPPADLWYSRDVAAIAQARGLGPVADFFVDAEASGTSPIGGLTVVQFRNTHLIYAVTWFGLAALVACGMGIVTRYERRQRQ